MRMREKGLAELWLGNMRERDHLEDLGVYGKMILKWVLIKWLTVNWIGVFQDGEKWRAVLNEGIHRCAL